MDLKSYHKSKKDRKGQAAIEYLTGNAWLVIIAVIGLIVLWELGMFTPPTPRRGSMGFSQLEPTDWEVSTQNKAYVRLLNDAGAAIKIYPGNMSFDVYDVSCNSKMTPGVETTINPGSSKLFIFYCEGTPKISNRFKIGNYYEADLVIDYTNLVSGRQHRSVGKVFGPIEGRAISGDVNETDLPGTCNDPCTHPGTINNPSINDTECTLNCTYCSNYMAVCEPQGDCGNPCAQQSDCTETCLYCNTTSVPAKCEQGDCGKPCDPQPCVYGCTYCDPTSKRCSEPPSCGTECTLGGFVDPVECKVECTYCYNYTLECVSQEDCGTACVLNEDCSGTCCYCSSNHICEQGDCGKACTPLTQAADCQKGCTQCIGGTCRGSCTGPYDSTTVTVTSSTTSSTSSSSSSSNADHWIIAGQVYPKNGSSG